MKIISKEYSPYLIFLFLFAVCLLTYSNSLQNSFMMDDYGLILENTQFRNVKFLIFQFVPDLHKYLNIEDAPQAVYYRPFAHVLPMVSYLLFKDQVFYHHLINLMLFIFCCFLVYRMVEALLNDTQLAFLTALLYAVHPINGLMVNYVTANVFAFQLLLMMSGVISFLVACQGQKRLRLHFASIFCYLLAVLCHETALVFPLYLISVLIFLKGYKLTESIVKCRFHLLAGVAILLFRFQAASLKVSLLDKITGSEIHLVEYVASFTKVSFWYLSRLIFPFNIVIKWGTPVVRENFILWLTLFLILGGVIIFSIACRNKFPKAALALSWLAIGLIPVSVGSAFQIHYGFIIEPHWLFFPSIGIFWLLASGLNNLGKMFPRQLAFIFIGTICVFLIIQSRTHNRVWGNEKAYTIYWHREAPVLKGPVFYLASVYMKEGDFKTARKYFHEALEGTKTDWQIYNNLGLMAFQEGKEEEAIENYNKALVFFPQSGVLHNNLGIAYKIKDELILAEETFHQSIKLNPFLLEPRLNLIEIYKIREKFNKIEELCKANLAIDAHDSRSLQALIEAYFISGKPEKALKEIDNILARVSRYDAPFLTNLGSIAAVGNQHKIAKMLLVQAVKRDKNYSEAYLELGKLYGNFEHFDQAIKVWQEGLRVDPTDERFNVLMRKAEELLKTKNR